MRPSVVLVLLAALSLPGAGMPSEVSSRFRLGFQYPSKNRVCVFEGFKRWEPSFLVISSVS